MTCPALGPDSVISRSPEVFTGNVDGEMMLMSAESGKYYLLNQVGGEVVALFEEPVRFGRLAQILQERFQVPRETLEADLAAFLHSLANQHIIAIA
jgi:hypothetical protein